MTIEELEILEAAFEAALHRVEAGETTVEDSETIRRYVEMVRRMIGDRLEDGEVRHEA